MLSLFSSSFFVRETLHLIGNKTGTNKSFSPIAAASAATFFQVSFPSGLAIF